MSQTTKYNLNQGQKDAAEAFFSSLFDPKNKGFILSGPAGVGKTYFMGYIIDEIMPRYHEMCKLIGVKPDYENVVMTATTNKAAEVLEYATGRYTQTIHSFLNLSMYEDYENGSVKLSKNPRTWVVHNNLIIFIDECSMIDSQLYKIIQEGTFNCKIVYVGDHNQLSPVTETLSPVYKQNYPFFELTEQMRTHVPALQSLNQQLRKTVETGIFNPIYEVPGIIDYLDDAKMQQILDITFTNQTKESRVLSYTNRRVVEYNDYIRQLRKLPNTFVAGEILVNNSPIKLGRSKVISVESEIVIVRNHGSAKVEIEKDNYLSVDYIDLTTHIGEIFSRIPVPTDRAHFNSLVKYYKSQKNWERFFFLKQNFPDFRPRDAATVHKAQGSTYENVFIDLGNISTCRRPEEAARMLYVAFSRAKSHIYVYGELSEKYGTFIKAV